MKKKKVSKFSLFSIISIITIFLLFLSPLIHSQETDEEKIINSYKWLYEQVDGETRDLTTKQLAFSILALNCNESVTEQALDEIDRRAYKVGTDKRCFGKGPSRAGSEKDCLLTETALVKLALDELGEESEKEATWLMSNNITTLQNIYWFLQIDTQKEYNMTCEIHYLNNNDTIKMNPDKTVKIINQGSNSCIQGIYQSYWFQIKPLESCYQAEYTIKCWSESTTYTATFLYKDDLANKEWFVSGETLYGISGSGNVEPNVDKDLKIPGLCLSNPSSSSTCDYEGTAWAAYVLNLQGETDKVNLLLPYLTISYKQPNNIQFFPSSFMAPLLNSIYLQQVSQLQKTAGYWLIEPIIYGRYYDTAKAKLALVNGGTADIEKAKSYLLETQQPDYSWKVTIESAPKKDVIGDTAFILWTFWGEYCQGSERGGGSSGYCDDQPLHACRDECFTYLNEVETLQYLCLDPTEKCCKDLSSGEGECQSAGGNCKLYCESDEFVLSDITSCNIGEDCCKPINDATCEEYTSGYGEICQSGYSCPVTEITVGNELCCPTPCISGSLSETECSNVGNVCLANEICMDNFDWREKQLEETARNIMCCVGGTCIDEDQTCYSLNGRECDGNYQCSGSTEQTTDVEECCIGECKATCFQLGGDICNTDETCSGQWNTNALEQRCCTQECKKSGGLSIIWIIVIIVVLLAGLFAIWWFFFRKKGKKTTAKSQSNDFGDLARSMYGPKPSSLNAISGQSLKTRIPLPTTQSRPIIPKTQTPSKTNSNQQTSKTSSKKITRKTISRVKTKTSDMENTLNKLRKMTKEK